MGETQESIVLKTAKEIVVKFIEVGRFPPIISTRSLKASTKP